jgi:hypothetical protein
MWVFLLGEHPTVEPLTPHIIVAPTARGRPSIPVKPMGKPYPPSPPSAPTRSEKVWELLFYLRSERERVEQKLQRIERWAELRKRRRGA